MSVMRAVVVTEYGEPEVLVDREIHIPAVGPGRILIRLMAAGVNPVDAYMREGSNEYRPILPFTPGMAGAGIIEDVGEGMIGYEIGERVYIAGSVSGTYAEYCICSPGQIFPLPARLGWAEAACLGVPYFTAARALFTKGRITEGDSVLIHGASGGVGLACLQLAAGRALRVFGTAGSDAGMSLVLRNGAEACFDHNEEGHCERIKEASEGIDLIVEMLANANLNNDITTLAVGARIVVVGSRGRIDFSPRDLMNGEYTLIGTRITLANLEEKASYAKLIEEGVEGGRIKPRVRAEFALEDSYRAHRMLMEGPSAGNVVLVF